MNKKETKKKTLRDKAINIKGKEYVLVKDRVIAFNEKYPNGCIRTRIVSDNEREIIFQATVIPDIENADRYFTGFAGGVRGGQGVDKTAAIENAETSAVGRALGMMGIGVIDSIASVDEMNKAGVGQGKEERYVLRQGEKNGRKWYGIFDNQDKDNKPKFFRTEGEAKAALNKLKMDIEANKETTQEDLGF